MFWTLFLVILAALKYLELVVNCSDIIIVKIRMFFTKVLELLSICNTKTYVCECDLDRASQKEVIWWSLLIDQGAHAEDVTDGGLTCAMRGPGPGPP